MFYSGLKEEVTLTSWMDSLGCSGYWDPCYEVVGRYSQEKWVCTDPTASAERVVLDSQDYYDCSDLKEATWKKDWLDSLD
jgi:hypothetical protein